MSIGTFTLIKNEREWIGAHLLNILPWVDQAVLFDGNSTDGTLEIIKAIQNIPGIGHKIKLHKRKDPANLQESYVSLFNECLHCLDTDLAWFLHPDMWVENPSKIPEVAKSDAIALSTRIRSFAGNPGGGLLEIEGRGKNWKNIYRLRNPDLGAHYYGTYGHVTEDVYFLEITGDQHHHYGEDFFMYPYPVLDSGIDVLHFSDVRPYSRRFDRMYKCMMNQGHPQYIAGLKANCHPRVTLESDGKFKFLPAQYPKEMLDYRAKFAHLEKVEVTA